MTLDDFKKKQLPDLPGVYFFLDKNKGVIYIGKATSLADRVKSYFSPDLVLTRGGLVLQMVADATDIKFEVTDSVLEAIILETNLIKKYQPKANTREKDDKSFNHVIITQETYPKVIFVRGKNIGKEVQLKDIKYDFGPYTQGTQLKEALKIVRKIFPYRDEKCIPAEEQLARGKTPKACFNHQIGMCPGVCVGAITAKEYGRTINHIRLFFEGKKSMLVKTLEKEMAEYAKMQEFEKAQDVKRILFALSHIQDVSLIKNSFHNAQIPGDTAEKNTQVRIEAYDIAHLSGTSMTGAFVVVEDGMPNKAEYRKFKIRTVKKSNDPAALAEVLKRRFKHTEWPLPQILVVDGNDIQKNVAEAIVKELNITGVTVVAVVKNDKHKARAIIGDTEITEKYQKDIILANEEAHRFVLAYHKKLRSDFLRP